MTKNQNILAVTYWSYNDALIQTYTLPYIKMIKRYIPSSSLIYLVTVEQKRLSIAPDKKKEIKRELKEQGIIWIDFHFSKLGMRAVFERAIQLIRLWMLVIVKRVDYIQAWCSPAGVTGYLLSALTAKPLILDSFEPHAEPSVENGDWKPNGIAYRFLFYFEKKQAKHAKIVIATSRMLQNYSKEKWKVDLKNIFVKPALIDLNKFNYGQKKNPEILKRFNLEDKIVCVYAGKIGGIYLEQEIFDFIKVCHNYWGDRFRFLMMTDAANDIIDPLCNNANLDRSIVINCYVPHKDIHLYIGAGDFALNPIKMLKSKKCCTSIKDGEYWALGLPVVITDSIGDDVKIIREMELGAVLEVLNEEAYLEAVKQIDNILKSYSRRELYDKIRPIGEQYRNYGIAEKIYSNIYADLTFS